MAPNIEVTLDMIYNREYKFLNKVECPEQLRNLSIGDLKLYAEEVRHYILECCSTNPGHLGSSLGTVELTTALHYVYDTPHDRIVWDVGHQAYAHKIITGRRDAFTTNRKLGGISGFPRMAESKYDNFGAGHSSVSISAAFGIAKAMELQHKKSHVVAVIGDGALTGGLAFEGLNNAGASPNTDILVILNDNEMSIDKPSGALDRYLLHISTSKWYNKFKSALWRVLAKVPPVLKFARRTGNAVKHGILRNSNLFESLNFRYFGVVDGHDLERLIDVLRSLKDIGGPKLLHIKTIKGKGYAPAEAEPGKYHGMPPKGSVSAENFSHRLGEILTQESATDSRVCAITAAMSEGTGLESFRAARPDRFFDVGIAEEHALTFAAGLAADGYKPVTAIYSSFMQRGYDQIIHDIALQKLPVLMCIDRAGLNAGDGPTHHGIFDVSFLSAIPNLTIYTPVTFAGLAMSVRKALAEGVPAAIRYPNGGEDARLRDTFYRDGDPTDVAVRESNPENHALPAAIIVTHGRITREALTAREILAARGTPVGILLCEYLKPYGKLADEISHKLPAGIPLLFAEEEIRAGGFGMMLTDALRRNGTLAGHPYTILATDDSFVSQDKPESILRTAGVDAEAMVTAIQALLKSN